jgi:hypothetical protein
MRVNLPSTLIAADGTALCLDPKKAETKLELKCHGVGYEMTWAQIGIYEYGCKWL